MVDAPALRACGPQGSWRFESSPRHSMNRAKSWSRMTPSNEDCLHTSPLLGTVSIINGEWLSW